MGEESTGTLPAIRRPRATRRLTAQQRPRADHGPARGFSLQTLILMDLRDALMRRSIERVRAFPDGSPRPPAIQQEMDLTSGALATVNAMLATGAPITPDILGQLSTLSVNLGGAAAPSTPRAPEANAGAASRRPNTSFHAGNFAARARALSLSAPGAPSGVAPPLEGLQRAVLQALAALPTNVADSSSAFIASYSQAMSGVEDSLPPLPPFSFTLPRPLRLGDLTIPAGSTIGRGPQGGFVISTPALMLTAGGNTIVAGQSTVHLGNSLDGFTFEEISVNEDARFSQATMGISRSEQRGFIRAQSAQFDLSSGEVHLQQAEIEIAPGSTHIAAARFLLESPQQTVSMEDFRFAQTSTGDTALSGSNLEYADAGNTLRAGELTLHTSAEHGNITAREVSYAGDHVDFNATQATLAITTSADGSSRMQIHGQDLAVTAGDANVSTTGDSQLQLHYGPGGVLQQVSSSAEDVRFTHATGSAIEAQGAALDLVLNPQGELAGVQAQAEQLRWSAPGRELDVTSGNLSLAYEDGLLASATARASELRFADGHSNASVTNGALDLSFGAAGHLQAASFSASAARFEGVDSVLQVAEGDASLAFTESGGLHSANAAAGRVELLRGEEQLSTTDSHFSATFHEATGHLASAQVETGALIATGAAGNLRIGAGANVTAAFSQAGTLERLHSEAGQVELTTTAGDRLTLERGAMDAHFGAEGQLASVSTHLAGLQLDGSNGDTLHLHSATANATFTSHGALQHLQASTGDVSWASSEQQLTASGIDLDLQLAPSGQLQEVTLAAGDLRYTGAHGVLTSNGESTLSATLDTAGNLDTLQATAEDLSFASHDNTLALAHSSLALSFHNGHLATAQANIGSGELTGAFGRLTLSEGSTFNATFNQDHLASLEAGVSSLTYAGEQGDVALQDGHARGTFGEDGQLERLDFTAHHLDFSGNAQAGQGASVSFHQVEAALEANSDGGHTLSLAGQQGALEVDGHTVGIEQVRELRVITGAGGAISQIEADFPGAIEAQSQDGNLNLRVLNLQGQADLQAHTATLTFGEADLAVQSQGLTATFRNGELDATSTQTRLFIGEGELLRELEGELPFAATVEGLELIMRPGEDGQLREVAASVEALTAQAQGMNILVRNQEGQHFRLEAAFREDGTALRRVFLQIPEGGEVEVARDDLQVTLGPQSIELTRGYDGTLRLHGLNNDLTAVWGDVSVRMDSQEIDVALDPQRGLVFNRIAGTRIDVSAAGQQVTINLNAIDNLMLRATGISGLAQGARLELVPTGPNSRLTANLRTTYNGIPIEASFDNLSALTVEGSVRTNEAHVLVADPGEQGNIRLRAGPLQLEGSAIELYARYREYNPTRMLSAVGRFMSTDGVPLAGGLSVEADGVVRLGTGGGGLFAEMAVLLPRGQGAAPSYLLSAADYLGEDRGGGGAVLSLGGAGTTAAGRRYVGSLFVGALPGSYLEIDRVRGSASLYGVPLPRRLTLPTSLAAGLNFRNHGLDSRWDATLGVFANPAGFVPEEARPFVHEDAKGGAFGGVSWRTGRTTLGLDALVDVDREGHASLGGVQVRVGFSL